MDFFNFIYYDKGEDEGRKIVIRLRPFKSIDIEKLLPWLADERIFTMWNSAGFLYPLTKEQIEKKLKEVESHSDEWVMAALDEAGEFVGHFYMRRADFQKNSVHLALIVVDENKRGQGLGRQMVEKAVEYAFSILGVDKVTLGVYECNPRAYACYQKVGFKEEAFTLDAVQFQGESWNRHEMAMER